MTAYALAARGIEKSFKTGKVFEDVSLAVEAGEILVVFGPSGTGKTVLLRIVAGVQDPDRGAVLIDGEDVTEASPERRGVGMAFQNFALFPHIMRGFMLSDLVAVLGSINIIAAELDR